MCSIYILSWKTSNHMHTFTMTRKSFLGYNLKSTVLSRSITKVLGVQVWEVILCHIDAIIFISHTGSLHYTLNRFLKWTRPGVNSPKPRTSWLRSFVNKVLSNTATLFHLLLTYYLWLLSQDSIVEQSQETIWSTKPKIFIICPFTGELVWPLVKPIFLSFWDL